MPECWWIINYFLDTSYGSSTLEATQQVLAAIALTEDCQDECSMKKKYGGYDADDIRVELRVKEKADDPDNPSNLDDSKIKRQLWIREEADDGSFRLKNQEQVDSQDQYLVTATSQILAGDCCRKLFLKIILFGINN